jgi:hypothetical protein
MAGINRTWPDVLQDLRSIHWNWVFVTGQRMGRAHELDARQRLILSAFEKIIIQPLVHCKMSSSNLAMMRLSLLRCGNLG